MQVVIALPRAEERDTLAMPVCGVPLLVRIITTALRSGGSNVLLVVPPGWPDGWLYDRLRVTKSARIETVGIDRLFDPNQPADWRAIAPYLEDRFLWMPCDCLVYRAALTELLTTAASHPEEPVRFSGVAEQGPDRRIYQWPTVLFRRSRLEGIPERFQIVTVQEQPGMYIRPPLSVKELEAGLVRRSGKVTDGVYSRFNRRLCWPAVRWLSHTGVTPNAVSLGGLAVAALAGICFARGAWAWDVAGAALFFLSGLFDEIDGMLARLKFQESAFGCWLETMADYSSYLLIFAGMTVGGFRRGGPVYLAVGVAALVGSVLSFILISVQRKLAAPADRPNEYSQRYLAALDRDARNPVSRVARQLQFLLKKGVLVHYLLLFATVGALPLLMFLAAFGANAAWIVTIYFNRRLFSAPRQDQAVISSTGGGAAEVRK